MNLKYLFGFHKWEKFGGPINVGGGKMNESNKSFQKHRDKRIKELHERMFKSKLHSAKKHKY